jgi:hypothetical protein
MIFHNLNKKRNFMKLQETRKHLLLALFIALAFVLTMYPTKAQAQIVDQLNAHIPFQFHAGTAKFPAGKYIFQLLDNPDLTVMEIGSVNGSTSTLFEVRDTQANSTPVKSELIFKKYGNRYFLAKVFEEGIQSGSQVPESRYEKKVAQAAADGEEHLPARKLQK